VVVAIGGIITAVGVVSFIVAYGLLKGMGWAWTLTVVLSIISILLNTISLAIGKFRWNSQHYHKRNNPLLHLQIIMSSHILEEVRVLHPQQLLRHSIFTIETLLRRVNDIGKSLELQKMNKACKQLNPLSLDQGLYLPDCRIPDEAYSLKFYFLSMDSF
jgi:hypothetical protein